jgi:MFS family permease
MGAWLVIVILAVSQFVMILDSTVMNVSISTVAEDLNTSITGMQAAITFYALTMAALMLTGGKLGAIWGRHNAFKIGSIVYGIGSLITALSPSLGVLLIGWSLIEGLGAVLVIPAIASLTAINYHGRSRVIAFAILGAVTGLAAAVGPIIGGLFTTYLSWRYVFAAETLIMAGVLLLAGRIKDQETSLKPTLDIPSALLSVAGLGTLVFGILQSKTWGWIDPKASPEINGNPIEPLGISLVAYLILFGILILLWFFHRQKRLEETGGNPLLKVSLLKIPILRSGLAVLLSQYFIIAALFFVVPVYLQTVLGYNAIETGLKLVPLSLGLVIFSAVGSRLTSKRSTKRIVRIGQFSMAFGALLLVGAVDTELKAWLFGAGMFVVGAGFGLLASQLGNVNMSAVESEDTPEVGGLQGTYQNFGTSLGTALVGSVFILSLSSGFSTTVLNSPNIPQNLKNQVSAQTEEGVPIVSDDQANQMLKKAGVPSAEANEISQLYESSQIESLKKALFFIFAAAILGLALSRHMPDTEPTKN